MADIVSNKKTSLAPEEVIMRSVQCFSTGKWRCQSQSEKVATFVGRPPIPVGSLVLMILGFIFCIIPGIIMYAVVIKKVIVLQNIVVTASPKPGGSDVMVKHSNHAKRMVTEFLEALPAAA